MDQRAALAAARSSSWEKRALAAESLTAVDGREADAALAALLDDPNLVVVRRAATSLLMLQTVQGLKRFTAAYSDATDQIGDAMNDELRVAVVANPNLRPTLTRLARDGDVGARAALAWLG